MNESVHPVGDDENDKDVAAETYPEVERRAGNKNILMRPARRVYVAVLFLLMCIAIAITYAYLQNNFNNQNDTIKKNFDHEVALIAQHNNNQIKLIQSQRWRAAYDSCKDTNERNQNSYKVFVGIVKRQEKNLSPARRAQAQAAIIQYKFLFQAFFPFHKNCRLRATRITRVPDPKTKTRGNNATNK